MNIAWFTDMAVSGYKHLSVPLCEQLAAAGHKVRVLGLGYKGEEHNFPFSIIPCGNFNHLFAMVTNLQRMGELDVLVVGIDIPLHGRVMSLFPNRQFKYWGIFPVESTPLQKSWANILNQMDEVFVLSEFGKEEIDRHEIKSWYLPIGVDTQSWRLPLPGERENLRGSYGIAEDEFVILTVADNQERKLLSRTAQIIRDFKEQKKVPVRWLLVTRINLEVGWNIPDLVSDMGLVNETLPIERGISFKELWSLYVMADCFLLTSKTEGIGIPAIEAMAVGIPVAETDCTGLRENMRKGGGFPIAPEKMEDDHLDPFGNSRRYFASPKDGVRQLDNIYHKRGTKAQVNQARGYVETLDWKIGGNLLLRKLEEMENAQA